MFKKVAILLMILSCVVFYTPEVMALGQMTEPIVVKDALRGEIVQSEIIAVNSDAKQINAQFVADGQIKEWTRFYLPSNLENQIATSTILAGATFRVVVFFDVPKDIANGEYKGTLSVLSVPDKNDSNESSASVAQKIDRTVSITISDKEEIDINGTSIIPESYDLSLNDTLKIRVIYDNQGNVSLTPQIRFKITKDGQSVYDMIYPYPEEAGPVNPKSQQEIKTINIETRGWTQGVYQAEMNFFRGDKSILDKNFKFTIAEKTPEIISDTEKNQKSTFFLIVIGILVAVIIVVAIIVLRRKK